MPIRIKKTVRGNSSYEITRGNRYSLESARGYIPRLGWLARLTGLGIERGKFGWAVGASGAISWRRESER